MIHVLIPAYKPDERLLALISEIKQQTDYDVLVVNDGSGSDFDAIFNQIPNDCTLLAHEYNRGKGRAMKTGFSYLVEHFPAEDGVVVVDADGQHLLKDVQRVCSALAEHPDCLIIGSRKFTGNVPLRSRFGNSLTRHIFALASGVKLTDTQTGLRAISLGQLEKFLSLKGERYEYEMNMLLHAAEIGVPMREVFIETVYIDENASSHFHVIRDSFKIYAVIFKFIGASLSSFLIDYVLFLILRAAMGQMSDQNLAIVLSTVFARIVSSFFNFMVNRKIVFKSQQNFAATLIKYYVLAAFLLGANILLLMLFENVCHIPSWLAQILAQILLYTVSYFIQRMFVFKSKSRKVSV